VRPCGGSFIQNCLRMTRCWANRLKP
jgi:hypothetical protein